MIPRRRLDLGGVRLLVEMWRTLFESRAAAAAQVAAFEREFAARVGVPFARATASGRDALSLILDGLGLQAGDELIVPAYTLGELIPLMQAKGLRLVAADIDPETLNVTPEHLRAALSPATRAILVAHLFGAPCDIVGICRVAGEHGLAVIEDCAHAPGATVGGQPVGSFGTAALFSLEVNKPVPTFGGGVLATRSPELAARVDAALAGRRQTEWPAVRKALLKVAEEWLVRSPLYALLARRLFSGAVAGRFAVWYRRAHGRVRVADVAFSGFQARLGRWRLAQLAARNARLNRRWQDLAAALPAAWAAQRRDAFGAPCAYNFVALAPGDLALRRQQAAALGVDLGIYGEVMDDVGTMLGQSDCPAARCAFAQAMLLPLYDGLSARRLARLSAALASLERT